LSDFDVQKTREKRCNALPRATKQTQQPAMKGVEKPEMFKAIMILAVGAALIGLSACAKETKTTTTKVSSTYAK